MIYMVTLIDPSPRLLTIPFTAKTVGPQVSHDIPLDDVGTSGCLLTGSSISVRLKYPYH